MRRNVLTASLAACALTASWPAPLFGSPPAPAPPVRAPLQTVERPDLRQKTGPNSWMWEMMRGGMTIPLGPTWSDPWPNGPCGAAGASDVH